MGEAIGIRRGKRAIKGETRLGRRIGLRSRVKGEKGIKIVLGPMGRSKGKED